MVGITQYGKGVLSGEIAVRVREIIRQECAVLEGAILPDLLQFFTVSRDGGFAASLARQEMILHRTHDLAEIAFYGS